MLQQQYSRMAPAALGTLQMPMPFGKHFTVTGGPSHAELAQHMFFVKMAAEIQVHCDVSIPTRDFKTPPAQQMHDGLIEAVLQITSGKPVYVGCMAGRGRTGLFLAVLAKAFGIVAPVEYVREHYFAHAVETDEQYAYVMNFPIPQEVTNRILWSKLWSVFSFKKNLTKAHTIAQ